MRPTLPTVRTHERLSMNLNHHVESTWNGVYEDQNSDQQLLSRSFPGAWAVYRATGNVDKAKSLLVKMLNDNMVRESYILTLREACWDGAVCTAPSRVAVAAALQAVTPPTAVFQGAQACQQAWIFAHEVIAWTTHRFCTTHTFQFSFVICTRLSEVLMQ
jgi:hypothetical protein